MLTHPVFREALSSNLSTTFRLSNIRMQTAAIQLFRGLLETTH
jgi:hypothetical protein